MAKQRRRRGHIQLRSNGTFRVHVYAGRDPITKKPRYLSETTKTYDDAEKAMTRLLAQVDRERSPTTSGTVGYLLSRWLEVADLELTTRDGYEGYIRRNILPTLGDVPLRKLDTEMLDRFYAHLRARGGRCRVCWDREHHGLPPLSAGEPTGPSLTQPRRRTIRTVRVVSRWHPPPSARSTRSCAERSARSRSG
jgi:hypothetical protein